jgi:hypothetical protein
METTVIILFLKQAHLLDWQGDFALHEQNKNHCSPKTL